MKTFLGTAKSILLAAGIVLMTTGCQQFLIDYVSMSRDKIDKSISLKLDGTSNLSVNEGSSILLVPFLSESRTEPTTIVTTVSSVRNDTSDHFANVTFTTIVDVGQQSTAITIPILHDTRYSGDREYAISISSPDIGDALLLTTTVGDIESPPLVNFSSAAVSRLESAGTQSVGLTLSLASTNPITVPFTVSNIGTTDADHTLFSSSVTFAPGETTQYISYGIVGDSIVEPSEDFSIELNAPPVTSATLGGSVLYTVTVVDDDQPSMPTALQLTEPSINIATDTTPTILVSGVEAGNTIRLYSDASCTNLVASSVAASTTHSLTSSALMEGSYEFAATRSNSLGVFSACSTATVVYVVDTTPVTVSFNKVFDRFDEGSGAKSLSLTMSGVKPYNVVVSYTNAGTTASSNLIGGFTSGTVTIPAGQTTAAIPVNIGSDSNGNNGERRVQANLTKTNSSMVRMGALTHSRISIRDTDIDSVEFASVSNGNSHSCGISTNGKLFCWGKNEFHQLGNGSTVDSHVPILIDAANSYASVSAGYKSTCAITTSDVLKCWGSGYWGNIGDGSNSSRSTPTTIESGIRYKKVSSSYEGHVCGITIDAELKCWGANDYGQLGDGTTVSTNLPIHISSGTLFRDVSTGHQHTCAITTAGKLKCWGRNQNGRLGNGNTTDSSLPIDIDSSTNYSSVSLGHSHSCAIDTSGLLKCWGNNSEGELGDGTTTSRNTPTVIGTGSTYASVNSGESYTCAIRSTGALQCWGTGGYDRFGQVGDGSIERKVSPQTIDSGVNYAFVDAGMKNHTCGITTDGLTKCWGSDSHGKLGVGSDSDHLTPVTTLTDATYAQVSIHEYHGCGITSTGSLRCWGNNEFSQLGDGSTVNRSVPVELDPESKYTKLSLNLEHGCAITTTGALKCWGRNGSGQVDGTLGSIVSTPTLVDSGVSYKEVAAGRNHTCGITSADVLKCWGGNGSGQSNVDPGVAYSKIAAGNESNCGVTTGGVLKCWGSNWNGNLGDGTTTTRTNPVVIDSGTSYLSVSVNDQGACGITTGNALRCWGRNYYGQVGDQSTSDRESPVTITSGISSVSVGFEHTCAVSTAGSVTCWGGGEFGRLGAGAASNSSMPLAVDAATTYTAVSAGVRSTCGQTTLGAVKCWGTNLGGRFGDGLLNHYPAQVLVTQ